MKEVGADEGIVVTDLRVGPLGTKVGIEKNLAIPPAPDFLVHPLVIYVAGNAGKLEVFEKGFAIPFPLLALEDQEFVHDVRLEGIEGRGKPAGEAKLPVEPLSHLLVVLSGVDVCGRGQFRKVGMYEVRIVDELGVELEQLVHLLLGEVFVNDVRTETPGVLVFQILEDQGGQSG